MGLDCGVCIGIGITINVNDLNKELITSIFKTFNKKLYDRHSRDSNYEDILNDTDYDQTYEGYYIHVLSNNRDMKSLLFIGLSLKYHDCYRSYEFVNTHTLPSKDSIDKFFEMLGNIGIDTSSFGLYSFADVSY